MNGDEKPILGAEEYRRALSRLEALIHGKKEICILFDDISRPTKAWQIIPYILEIFERRGVRDEQVRFICALGTHAPLDNSAFRKKLGDEVMERFPVYNHNPYENCDYRGRTRLGTPVMVNREFLSCDLRLGIGALVPHSFCGIGGGYKIVMPGVSHIDAITHHHGTLMKEHPEAAGIGNHAGNVLFEDVKESGRICGLHAKIDVLVNSRADTVGLFVGRPEDVNGPAINEMLTHYTSTAKAGADVVFVNAHSKANEVAIAVSLGESLLKEEGGTVVVLADVAAGQVVHYLFGRFGRETWGRLGLGERTKSKKSLKVMVYSRYRDMAGAFWFGKAEDVVWFRDMAQLVKTLDDESSGKPLRALVIQDATVQIVKRAT
jgi:nickel-dependent lactate racemase